MASKLVDVNVMSPSNVTALNKGHSKRAYVTFLAGNGDYVKGVVGLAKGLRKVKSSSSDFKVQGCLIREIDPIYPPVNQIQFARGYFVITYSKLRVWNHSKPWSYIGKEENMDKEDIKMLVSKWWDIYKDETLDFKVENPTTVEDETFLRPSIDARRKAELEK